MEKFTLKRDWELCRTILRLTEELPEDEDHIYIFGSSELEGFTRILIGYHVHLLQEAGLVETFDARTMNDPWNLYPRYLTMAGHDFLEATRNDNVWNKTLAVVKSKGGGMTLEILKDIALTYLRSDLGI